MRCDSAAMVPNTRELFPDPETPVNTVSRRLGKSTLMSLRLFSLAPWTRMVSWVSAECSVAMRLRLPAAADAGPRCRRPCGLLGETHEKERGPGRDDRALLLY